MVLYLGAKGRRKECLLKAAEAKRKDQYGYVEKTNHMFERIEKLLKKVLDKKSHLW